MCATVCLLMTVPYTKYTTCCANCNLPLQFFLRCLPKTRAYTHWVVVVTCSSIMLHIFFHLARLFTFRRRHCAYFLYILPTKHFTYNMIIRLLLLFQFKWNYVWHAQHNESWPPTHCGYMLSHSLVTAFFLLVHCAFICSVYLHYERCFIHIAPTKSVCLR